MPLIPTARVFRKALELLASPSLPTPNKVELMNELHPSLEAVFAKVRPTTHWKDPINAVVPLTSDELAILPYAVEFFTATVPTIRELSGRTWMALAYYSVTAAGYRAGPAGDH